MSPSSARFGQFALHVVADQFFQQQQPVDLPDDGPGLLVARHVGRIAGEKVADDLIHRVVSFFPQRMIDVLKNLLDVLRRRRSDAKDTRAFALVHVSPTLCFLEEMPKEAPLRPPAPPPGAISLPPPI